MVGGTDVADVEVDEPGAFHESRTFAGIDRMFYFRILEAVALKYGGPSRQETIQ